MTLIPGTRLGPYEVVAQVGQGGMGEVYRATDTSLGRSVAIKVLPEAFAQDADRLARFEREAKTLAALNHPNIAQIYGFEKSGGAHALVMELVEGPTLADRIAQGAIPVGEALAIAKQIAEALEAAHEQGIIHRDLKPANIKVRPDGTVKVLDFGLAKAMEPVGAAAANASQLPTITTPAMTQAGMILGTAAYMSPEQASGKPVDRRTDLWAFGVVLLEMLTGRRVFDGETVPHVLAAVLAKEPDWTTLPANTPASIRKLLRRCLEKDRKRRMESAADARLDIEDVVSPSATGMAEVTESTTGVSRSSPSRARLVWPLAAVVAALAAAGLAVPALRHLREAPRASSAEMRLDIVTPPAASGDPMSFALSPDGRQIAYVAVDDGVQRIWLRHLGSATAQPLPGTDGARYPFWSPDSRSLAFFAGAWLKRLDVAGGQPQVLAEANLGRGGSWSAHGVVVFARGTSGGLFRVAATGGDVVPVTHLVEGQTTHRFPHFLPGGQRFLFLARGAPDVSGIYVGSLDSQEATRVTASESEAAYLSPGWLLWIRDGALVTQQIDTSEWKLANDQVTLAHRVAWDPNGEGGFTVSESGLVAYRSGAGEGRRQLAWFDRAGIQIGTVAGPDANFVQNPVVSPDGRRVAGARTVQGNTDVWVMDGTRISRFTFDAAVDNFPIWSPDGSRIVFRSDRTGVRNLFVKPSGGIGEEEILVDSADDKTASNWSADGRFIFFMSTVSSGTRDVWVVPLQGDRTPRPFLQTSFDERHGQFSPDGRWVAYISNESGRDEIHVRPFTEPGQAASGGGQWQVSTGGGIHPLWRADGRELYYLAPDGTLMAVPVQVTGTAIEPGAPVALFQTRIVGGGVDAGQGRQYDVARDGRFLINTIVDDEVVSPITVLQNWRPPDAP